MLFAFLGYGFRQMPSREIPPIEPFVERTQLGGDGAGVTGDPFGSGWKRKQGRSLCDLFLQKSSNCRLTDGFLPKTKMAPTGTSVRFSRRNRSNMHQVLFGLLTTVEQLVAEALSSESLRLEEAGSAELKSYNSGWKRATSLVKDAIERLSRPKQGYFLK